MTDVKPSDHSYRQQIRDAAEKVRAQSPIVPRVGLVLGSGLGKVAQAAEEAQAIPFADLPHWPVSSVAGHAGRGPA